jgi:hypothetical protein
MLNISKISIMSINPDLEYYENSDYYIDKAINDWDKILEIALLNVSSHQEGSNIMRYENDYKNFLIKNRDSIFLFNSLEQFEQIVSVCNFHHQNNLLKNNPLLCVCQEHHINIFNIPYHCDLDDQSLVLNNNDRSNYDYLGFINQNKPCGEFIPKQN